MSVYEKSLTLVGPTIFYKETEDSKFSLNINRSGILLSDGFSEIPIEIGENGEEGNLSFTSDTELLSERETFLIYQIALYQYREFKRTEEDE